MLLLLLLTTTWNKNELIPIMKICRQESYLYKHDLNHLTGIFDNDDQSNDVNSVSIVTEIIYKRYYFLSK